MTVTASFALVVLVPATALLVTATDLMVVAALALACFGLPGIAALFYLRRRAGD